MLQIRKDKTELKDTWSVIRATKPKWCVNYAASVVKVAGGQFHDTHAIYSERVQRALDKLAVTLIAHVDACKECEQKKELPPPYLIKDKLYAISAYLKPILQGHPSTWKSPWFVSDKLRDEIFSGSKVSKDFMDAYDAAHKYLKRAAEDGQAGA